MPSLCLLACRMFEDEVVHLIEEDRDSRIVLIDNGEDEGIKKKLDRLSIDYDTADAGEIANFLSDNDELTLVVYFLEFALDADPHILKEEVYHSVEEIAGSIDGILVLYGLCGNVLGSIEYDFRELDIPVRILKDRGGHVVDDCICASFGNQASYINAMKGEKQGEGTYFLTPMQAVNWKEMLVATRLTPDPDNVEMTKMVFDYSGYKNVGKVDTGLHYEKEFDRTVNEFATTFGFKIRLFEGSTEVVDECYNSIKKEILKIMILNSDQ
ncbi:DUF1638 domain-containing protein [Methanolobus sp. ZRKC3]|uniref:DUF1638 domain-containing protein n=1 Tax=Methanolobus sp. ZRKC3 TaxID=3125786 RepID=UPI0032555D5F